jgi:hypothetical protein
MSGISAMLDDVRSDVGKAGWIRLSTSLLGNGNPFHTSYRLEVESFQHSADPIDTRLQLGVGSD